MNKEYFGKVFSSPVFLIPSIIIFAGVTVLYVYEFYSNNYYIDSLASIAGYWSIYIVITLFLQFVIFVNAKKQIIKNENNNK